jgi:hypothetical protein
MRNNITERGGPKNHLVTAQRIFLSLRRWLDNQQAASDPDLGRERGPLSAAFSEGRSPLLRPSRHFLVDRTCRFLVAAAVVAHALLLGATASGSSVGSSREHRPGGADNHHCKCASCRGESSCCCKSVEPEHRGTDRQSIPIGPQSGSSPHSLCISNAPCHGDGLPTTAPNLSQSRTAALPASVRFRPTSASRPIAIAPSLVHTALDSARIDEPPEHPVFCPCRFVADLISPRSAPLVLYLR